MVLRHSIIGGNLLQGFGEKVPADKEGLFPGRKPFHKAADGLRKLPGNHLVFRAVAAGKTLRKFLQRHRHSVAALLLGEIVLQAVNGNPPQKLRQEHTQNLGPVGRHGVPGGKISVVDALLGILSL